MTCTAGALGGAYMVESVEVRMKPVQVKKSGGDVVEQRWKRTDTQKVQVQVDYSVLPRIYTAYAECKFSTAHKFYRHVHHTIHPAHSSM